ncbi:MAG TPA: hypothetical protein VHE34_20980 [Puia sp.]|uniref:hypothetical protein n=1 Tax=Puia sp. TaxID=2045100 RepID=UPI002D14E7B5|nr:hypothetical protein [Puia sp.]HVU97717.1 hypothetical protein [Puia sp.]
MLKSIYIFSILINLTANFLALAIGVACCYRNRNPSYVRIFPVYLFVSVAIELLVNEFVSRLFHFKPFGDYQDVASNAIYNLYTPFELFIFSWFLLRIIRSVLIKRLLVVSVVAYGLFFITYSWRFGIGSQLNTVAILLESAVIIIPCLIWYWELFSRNESLDLMKEPAFWLVTGIFFYLATIIPFFIGSIYLTNHGFLKVTAGLFSINNFTLVVTYILFIKGFTCRKETSDLLS